MVQTSPTDDQRVGKNDSLLDIDFLFRTQHIFFCFLALSKECATPKGLHFPHYRCRLICPQVSWVSGNNGRATCVAIYPVAHASQVFCTCAQTAPGISAHSTMCTPHARRVRVIHVRKTTRKWVRTHIQMFVFYGLMHLNESAHSTICTARATKSHEIHVRKTMPFFPARRKWVEHVSVFFGLRHLSEIVQHTYLWW